MKDTGWTFQGYRVLESENVPTPVGIRYTDSHQERTMNPLECLQSEYGVKDHVPINAEVEWSELGITIDVFGKYRDGTIAMNARRDGALIVRKFYPHPELRRAR